MNRKFLDFTVSRNGAKLKVADKAINKLKDRIKPRSAGDFYVCAGHGAFFLSRLGHLLCEQLSR